MIPPHQGGHRRNGSEFIGGDGKSGLTGLMSTSPTKGKGPVHLNLPRLPLLPKRLPTESRMIPPHQGGHRRNGSEFIGGDGKSGLTGLMSTSPTKGGGAIHLDPRRFGGPFNIKMLEVRDRVLKGIEKPAKRRSPKQKAAIETPTSSNANDNDFAAGYGSDGETRTENSTPSKAAARKSRAPRKAKDDADGEPAVKKQKTSKDAKSIKAASHQDFTGQLLIAASPVKHELVKMETGTQSRTKVEDKRQLEKMEEDADAEHDEE
ncbi:MAG: hypothetical protein Q9176_000755 [Flavoplaca citrina]